MTSVLGHLTETDFGPEYKSWSFPPPENLFGARIYTSVAKVRPYTNLFMEEAELAC